MIYSANKITQIRKRDGRIADFSQDKITIAVGKAIEAVDGEKNDKKVQKLSDQVAKILNKKFHHRSIPAVEEVQDIVEEVLIRAREISVAKAYILYRDQHAKIRELETLIDSNQLMGSYLDKLDWLVRENSNMAFSLQGLNNHISSAISSHYWLNKVYPPEVREAYQDGDFHIHDLQILAAYCCGWDLKDLLMRGFGGVSGKIESKSAKHLRSALGQVVNFFYTLQGEVAGAQAFANFDTLLAPFIRYDGLDYKSVKQAMQEFVFNVNVPTRVGFQTPFTNVTMDLTPPSTMAEEAVIIGGQPQKEKYKDFQPEIDMFNRAFAEVMLAGDAKGRVFSFPIPTYNITPDFEWEKKELEPIWEMTAKYGIPYFANFVNSDMKAEDARSMCPLAGDEKVLIRSTRGRGLEYSEIRNIYEGHSRHEEYEIYSHSKFVKGKFNKFLHQEMIKVILGNNHKITMSEEHLNFVMRNRNSRVEIIKGKELKKGMYFPYSLKVCEGSGGNRDIGYFVGAFAGDGSFDGETSVVFSLENERKKQVIEKLKNIATKYFGANYSEKQDKKTKLYTLKIHSRAAVGLCKDFVVGQKRDKYYAARIFGASAEFRRGVLAGHYDTDGGNRHRIYTSSWKMVESLNMLAATLGTTTSILVDSRKNRLGKEPNYAVLIYQLNRKNYGDFWFIKGDKLWVKIGAIKPAQHNVSAYCFEVKNGEPMFTVGTTGILTHNCRLRLDNRELRKRGGGLFAANPLTGSIGVVTINMPRIGYLSKTRKEFFDRLARLMDLAKKSLEIKREVIEKLTDKGLYPYCRYYLSSMKERFNEYWRNHFNTIGLIGMNEACLNFLGRNIATDEGHDFAKSVLDFMRERLMDYQLETNNLYNLEATPGEGTSYSLVKKDKIKYPDIVVANEKACREKGAVPYYTNSTHLPVGFTDDYFEALRLQDDLQTKYTGGTVLHGFIGERLPSGDAAKLLVKKIASQFHLPYFSLTPTFSVCPKHGYLEGEHQFCPKCDEEIGYKEI